MAYYYVKSGGTATADAGRATTKRTGSFATMGASAYYDSIFDAYAGGVPTTAVTESDNVMVSDLHSKVHTTHRVMGMVGTIYSVDDANADAYKKGASEHVNLAGGRMEVMTSSAAVYLRMFGVELKADRYLRLNVNQPECKLLAYDCDFEMASAGFAGYITLAGGDGCDIHLDQCTLTQARTDGHMILSNGSRATLTNCAFPSSITTLVKGGGSSGLRLSITNSDLTSVTGQITDILTASTADIVDIELVRCTLASGTILSSGTWAQKGSEITADLLAYSTDTDVQYYRIGESYIGEYSTDTAIYRTAGASYDGTNGFSTEIVSNANTSFSDPLRVEIYHGYVDTADYTTTVDFKVHFSVDGSATALNSDEVYFEVEHADGADNAIGVIVSSAASPLAAGGAPTTETALWTGLGGTNKQMSVSQSATIGTTTGTIASGVVRVFACVAKASQTIFVCPEVVIS